MKKKILVLYIIITLVALCSNVYATFNTNLSLTKNKETVKAGEDVIISVNLRNMTSNISAVTGYIDIDENVLNGMSEDAIVKNSKGNIEVTSGQTVQELTYAYAPTSPVDVGVLFNTNSTATNGHDVFFVEDFNNDLSNDSVILQLKVTVKQGVNNGDLEKAVKIVDLVAESAVTANGTATTDETEKLSADVIITVDNVDHEAEEEARRKAEEEARKKAEEEAAKKAAEEAAKKKAEEEAARKAAENSNKNTNTNNTNTNTNRNTNTNTNKTNTNTNTNKDNTVSGSRLPATGARTIIIPGLVLCLLGFISYRKYMNYKEIK